MVQIKRTESSHIYVKTKILEESGTIMTKFFGNHNLSPREFLFTS